ncbi:hypothetical protein NXV74_23600 [Bacteroides thetaiotaomicron]|nr:hypothetical protein [Bacteroides thetaiotaomicron]MCS3264732.1 hypothetical protein [Bacteroides thetaiotaomicron]
MNKRIISFICAGLIAISCVSSLCFYDYFSTDGITPNAIYWIFYFFQISILLGQAGMGIYTINALLRQKKEAVSFFELFCSPSPSAKHDSSAPNMGCTFHYGISRMATDVSGHF